MAVVTCPTPRPRPRPLKRAKRKLQPWLLGGLLAVMLATAILAALSDRPTTCSATGIPTALMPLYTAAEQRYGVAWSLLAAINSIESDFGHNNGPSSAGALGPMQFMPATWRHYGLDANNDGHKNIMDPHDAIPAAARLLKANGAPNDVRRALFAYNHAQWYVDKVLALSTRYADGASCTPAATGNATPQAVYDAANTLHAMRIPYTTAADTSPPRAPAPAQTAPTTDWTAQARSPGSCSTPASRSRPWTPQAS